MRFPLLLMMTIAGILAGHAMRLTPVWGLGVTAAGLLAALADAWYARKSPLKAVKSDWIGLLSAAFVMCGLGMVTMSLHEPPAEYRDIDGRIVTLRGRVKGRTIGTRGERFTVEVPYGATTADVMVVSWGESGLEPGDIVVCRGKAVAEESEMTGSPAMTVIMGFKRHPEKVGHSGGVDVWFWSMRERLAAAIEHARMGSRSRAMLKALLLADRDAIGREERELLKDAGLSHALALSGLHVGILAFSLLILLVPLNLVEGWKVRYLVVMAFVWVFVMLTGMGISAVRAALMFTLMGAGRILERRIHPFQGLCLAAIIIILRNPWALDAVGFQLSFMCVASLTLFAEPLNPVDHHRHPRLFDACGLVMTTLTATGATWMLMGYHFGEVTADFLPANMIMLPLLPYYMGIGILHVILTALNLEIEALGAMLDKATEWAFALLEGFHGDTVPMAPQAGPTLLWCLGVLVFGMSLNRRRLRGMVRTGSVRTQEVWRPGLWVGGACGLAGVLLLLF
ncbi:MAG: ComEC/Rec2 family competence protein [Bacteroides sp.]|nr:ComEC/Rec2 family competence protein [Bacteroides sp.]